MTTKSKTSYQIITKIGAITGIIISLGTIMYFIAPLFRVQDTNKLMWQEISQLKNRVSALENHH